MSSFGTSSARLVLAGDSPNDQGRQLGFRLTAFRCFRMSITSGFRDYCPSLTASGGFPTASIRSWRPPVPDPGQPHQSRRRPAVHSETRKPRRTPVTTCGNPLRVSLRARPAPRRTLWVHRETQRVYLETLRVHFGPLGVHLETLPVHLGTLRVRRSPLTVQLETLRVNLETLVVLPSVLAV